MAFKQFQVAEIGTVTVYKRRGSRSLRLSIRPDGELRVTIPPWTTYSVGINFARTRAEWIAKHRRPAVEPLQHNQQIGKAHRLAFVADSQITKVSTRVKNTEIVITYPAQLTISALEVQKAASSASIRALKAEARKLLPIRLQELAHKYGFTYGDVTIKQLKTRWGSCDQDRNIALNLFLMQLPWQLIDYVLLHELTHTRVMQHGPTFWQAMETVEPKAKLLRKAIREHHPVLEAQN